MTAPLRLWPAELDALRPEARAATLALGALIAEQRAATAALDGPARLAAQRRLMAERWPEAPGGTDEALAGVPCRVFEPDNIPRAVYLHFHGGGMALGSARMSDTENRALAARHGVAVVSVDYRRAPRTRTRPGSTTPWPWPGGCSTTPATASAPPGWSWAANRPAPTWPPPPSSACGTSTARRARSPASTSCSACTTGAARPASGASGPRTCPTG